MSNDRTSLARQRAALIRKQLAELPEDREALCDYLKAAGMMLNLAAQDLEGDAINSPASHTVVGAS
jgi:hypothetical protein